MRAHISIGLLSIGLSVPALVLTFDIREKVLDRIVAGSVPGLFGLAQVGSSGPRHSRRRICRADGVISLAGGVRSVRLTGGVHRRGSGRRTYAG
jgi:hypothetical protein